MSKIRLAFCLLFAFSLAAQVADGPGVTVDTGNAVLLHRSAVTYPSQARMNNVEGTVVIEVTLDAGGNVSDLHVISGPDELRRTVMQSVLDWHFAHEFAGDKRQISVAFKPPAAATPAKMTGGSAGSGAVGGILGAVPSAIRAVSVANLPRVKSLDVVGLPDEAKQELLALLPLHEGDTPTIESMTKLDAAIRQFDEHLTLATSTANDGMTIRIAPPGVVSVMREAQPAFKMADAPPPDAQIRVDGNTQAAKLIRKTAPVYPDLARQARIQGSVRLNAVIAKDGSMANLSVISGHPLLAQAALDAVKNWAYQPTLLNGNPVDVVTEITVNFTLPDAPQQY